MSIASTALDQASQAVTNASPAAGSALTSLASNFSTFLSMLMTQLKNQDPTSPMDTNQFTSELVQFSSVEQQIATNTNLTKLIELTQGGEVMQASAMIGRQVMLESDHLPLQGSKGTVQFTAATAGPVQISISTDAGTKLRDVTVAATAGPNVWTWDGKNANGTPVADGSYKISVVSSGANGAAAALPFTVGGTATGVLNQNGSVQLQVGPQSVAFSAVRSVAN
ncbi:MAG: flagellar hook assembly protein FlgD [Acetobacteraceae bacterium]